ncbi:MAG: cell wall metabolism sensor histidine kinase WalK [Defluviitaleaceae bacterium]|nr:cell wall metabolism sensor histidine kinase WalK [Defluviitaleaceae bacterium]
MHKTIKFKLVFLFLTLVLIVMISTGIFLRFNIQNSESRRIYEELSLFANMINSEIIQVFKEQEYIERELRTQIFTTRPDINIIILDSSGRNFSGEYFSSSVIISAMTGVSSFNPWERAVDQIGEFGRTATWMSYAVPVYVSDTGKSFIIYLRQNVTTLMESLENTTITIIISIIIAMLLSAILGIFFSRTLTEPISILTKISKEIAKGNFDQNIPIFSDDEIGQLSESFNKMSKNLQTTLKNIEIEKNKIEIIVNSISDGIIAFDNTGKLVHANNTAIEIIGMENMYYDYILKLIRNSENDSLDTFKINDMFIKINTKTYNNKEGYVDGTVISMQDVTKHMKLDNMRKEFVANVSHEIRTPLTVIKTYTETIIDMEEDEMKKSFLNTINSEVDRMTILTSDLLELSHFDNKQLKINNAKQNLIDILKNAIKYTKISAEKKSQKIILKTDIDKIEYFCDVIRINQVFVNIISNAIKYSKENTEINILVKKNGNYYDIYICDKGIGIKKDDIDRIFERFYRVDKSRSRNVGSTGLGLSIVKEILDIYNGKINVDSTPNVGTKVIISFPLQFM